MGETTYSVGEAVGRPASKRSAVDWLLAGMTVALLLVLLAKVALSARYSWEMIRFPFQIDDSEGVILSGAQWLSRGVNVYTPVRSDLFISAPYTPLYYLLNAAAMPFVDVTFKVGRVISLLSTLAIAGLIYRIAWLETRKHLAALVASAAFLGMSLVAVWAVRVKPDVFGLALALTGVYVVLELSERSRKVGEGPVSARAVYAAVPFFVLAFGTKQTLLAAPLAVFLWLLFKNRWLAIRFALLYLGAVAIFFVALNLTSDGGFYQDIVGFHGHWSPTHFLDMWKNFAGTYWPLLALTSVYVAVSFWRRRNLLLPIYALTAFVFAAQVGTFGGSHNHFLEMSAVIALAGGLLLGAVNATAGTWRYSTALATLALLAFLAVASFQTPDWLAWEYRVPTASQREGLQNVASYVTNFPGEVFSDNVGILLIAGKPVRYTDPYTMMEAARRGTWNETGLVKEIQQKKFSLVVLSTNVEEEGNKPWDISPAVYQAIRENYRIDQKNVLFIYRPRETS